jgi:hypothetical protein
VPTERGSDPRVGSVEGMRVDAVELAHPLGEIGLGVSTMESPRKGFVAVVRGSFVCPRPSIHHSAPQRTRIRCRRLEFAR